MSTECCSEWGEWDDQSFVLKTPLRDAFVARQIQHAFDLVPPNRRTRNREGAARAGDPLNEAVWVTGIAEEIKRRNATNAVRDWLQIFCETWLHRDSPLDDIDDSTIEDFVKIHWALHTKSESERIIAENMMERVRILFEGRENLQKTSRARKERRGKSKNPHRRNTSKRGKGKKAEAALNMALDMSLVPGAPVLRPGEPPKKRRRTPQGAYHRPDAFEQVSKVEAALPANQDPQDLSSIPVTLDVSIEAPKQRKQGRKRKFATPPYDLDPSTQVQETQIMAPAISQDLLIISKVPSPPPPNPTVEMDLDDDASLGWTKPPSPIPIPRDGRYPSSDPCAQGENRNNRTRTLLSTPISTDISSGPSVKNILTIKIPPRRPISISTLNDSNDVVPTNIFPFIMEQPLPHSRPAKPAKRVKRATHVRITESQPDTRPSLTVEPQIWAENRSEVSESLEYFRKAQGGVHSRDNVAIGYLLDGYPTRHDYCAEEGEIIISHGGGSMGTEKGEHGIVTAMKSDHNAMERSVKSLLNAFKERNPIAVLIGDRYNGFPFRLQKGNKDYRFIVLGWYAITHAWAYPESYILSTAKVSRAGQATRYMFRFQWLNSQGTPWWRLTESISALMPNATDSNMMEFPAESAPDVQTSEARALVPNDYCCECCGKTSPMIFDRPLCLQPGCIRFDKEYFPFRPAYNANILRRLPLDEHQYVIPMPIEPSIPVAEDSTSRRAWDGLLCPTCRKLTQRLHWKGWFCTVCNTYPEVANHRLRDAKDFSALKLTAPRKPLSQFPVSINPCQTQSKTVEYSGVIYSLPMKCKLYHLSPKSQALADELFRSYQTDTRASELFVRRRLNHSIVGHVQVNRHFAFNVGETYNYSSVPETVPSENSPPCVSAAKNEISSVVLHALRDAVEFNQVLSVAYMEGMGMNYHSDGEVGLNDVVASLSLGSPARMSFRLRNKPGKGAFVDSKIAEGEYHHWFDYACHSCRKSKLRVDEGPAAAHTETLCPTLLTVDIRHGDIFIMAGNTQRFYEHEIERVPGFRIAATCREIKDIYAHANKAPS